MAISICFARGVFTCVSLFFWLRRSCCPCAPSWKRTLSATSERVRNVFIGARWVWLWSGSRCTTTFKRLFSAFWMPWSSILLLSQRKFGLQSDERKCGHCGFFWICIKDEEQSGQTDMAVPPSTLTSSSQLDLQLFSNSNTVTGWAVLDASGTVGEFERCCRRFISIRGSLSAFLYLPGKQDRDVPLAPVSFVWPVCSTLQIPTIPTSYG